MSRQLFGGEPSIARERSGREEFTGVDIPLTTYDGAVRDAEHVVNATNGQASLCPPWAWSVWICSGTR